MKNLIPLIIFIMIANANANLCNDVVAHERPLHDSSVELEMILDEKVASFFTTENGKLMDLFNHKSGQVIWLYKQNRCK